jgi:general secretion pathway protein E
MSTPWDKGAKTTIAVHSDQTEVADQESLSHNRQTKVIPKKAVRSNKDEVTEIYREPGEAMTAQDIDITQFKLGRPSNQPLNEILRDIANVPEAELTDIFEHTHANTTQITQVSEMLLKKKLLTQTQLLEAMSHQTGLPIVRQLEQIEIEPNIMEKVPIAFAKKHTLMPFLRKGSQVFVAIANPYDLSPIDDLRILMGAQVKPVLALKDNILNAINRAYDRTSKVDDDLHQDLMDNLEERDLDGVDLHETQDLLDSDDEAPIIRLINTLMFRAVKEGASDIHIEPFEKEIAVRFRIDGVLSDIMKLPKKAQASITSRVKIMADLDIAEKRIPQDGRIKIKIGGRNVDIRVSTLPASDGESIVLRLLVTSTELPQLEDLGFDKQQLTIIRKVTTLSHGIFLVTGPTGSGKSTTLYTCLSSMNSKERKIITVENPVERQLDGVMQIQVNPKVNLTFASGLRSILRQDPDVIMIGEIRDLETAEIAIQASLTGHLVFSTIHTNDAAGSITRLIDMGVEPFLVASSLVGSMAQRLVRKLCEECKVAYKPSAFELSEIGITAEQAAKHRLYKASGCSECGNNGYSGRLGIYEIMPVGDKIRHLISKNVDAGVIKKAARDQEVKFLRHDGAQKVIQGLTSIEEVLRVTQEESLVQES